jgi:hypothetical protein
MLQAANRSFAKLRPLCQLFLRQARSHPQAAKKRRKASRFLRHHG